MKLRFQIKAKTAIRSVVLLGLIIASGSFSCALTSFRKNVNTIHRREETKRVETALGILEFRNQRWGFKYEEGDGLEGVSAFYESSISLEFTQQTDIAFVVLPFRVRGFPVDSSIRPRIGSHGTGHHAILEVDPSGLKATGSVKTLWPPLRGVHTLDMAQGLDSISVEIRAPILLPTGGVHEPSTSVC